MRPLTSLALTVLRLLDERPLHPYEMRQQMREQGLDQIVKVTHGALYHTVETLAKDGLITSTETSREGKRPERTVYTITTTGREVATDRLRELLSTTTREYPRYCLALAFLSLIHKEDAVELLERRCVVMEMELAALCTGYDALIKRETPRIALAEMLHMQAHLRTDLDLTRSLIEDIRNEKLHWIPTAATEHEIEK